MKEESVYLDNVAELERYLTKYAFNLLCQQYSITCASKKNCENELSNSLKLVR